jgi:hypothetical protein
LPLFARISEIHPLGVLRISTLRDFSNFLLGEDIDKLRERHSARSDSLPFPVKLVKKLNLENKFCLMAKQKPDCQESARVRLWKRAYFAFKNGFYQLINSKQNVEHGP